MESKSKHGDHIVMLPFMAYGHLIPFLALARQICRSSSFRITIVNTPLNIKYIRSTIDHSSDHLADDNIHLVELPFSPADEYGLPPNTENPEYLPLDLFAKFLHASTSLNDAFHTLLINIAAEDGQPPVCVISDVFCGWATDVAKRVGTVGVTFTTGGANGTLAYFSLWLNLPHREVSNSDEFHVPGFPDGYRLHITQLHKFLREADGSDPWSKFMREQISFSLQSFGILCNTVEEIEPLGLEWLRRYTKHPVWSVGPLLPPDLLLNNGSFASTSGMITSQRAGKQFGVSTEKCMEFLDLNDPCSVLYISFGSQNSISPTQMMELATGLEESRRPFIWVIRPPVGFDRRGEFKAEWLPDRFEERIINNKQGLLVRNWAPQLEILSHKSTGAFLSHCGWNSVMESLSQGVPIIGWPVGAEQAYNSKMLVEEMGVSVELTRGLQTSIEWKEVKKVIELVMDLNGEGNEIRRKAMEIRKLMRESVNEKGSFVKTLDDFVRATMSRH